MARPVRHGLGVALSLSFTVSTPVIAQPPPVVAVQVENYAELGVAARTEAQRVADAIYSDIGVHLVWVENDVERAAVQEDESIRVHLLSESMALKKIQAEGISAGVLATTSRLGRTVYVFVDRVHITADTYSRDRASVLGLVLAHEMGHVLLPDDSHSATGIMQDAIIRLTTDSRFTEAQGKLIRERLRLRTNRAPPD
ncbi:MAG TPA: hypothetical protein VFV95_15685 [Vicinamibacterales bacterium]|nr:hypothetical protein [Vicinamibacterales bacterium]